MIGVEVIPMKQTRIRVIVDRDAESPREYDNVGTMACWHRRYKLGDVQPEERPDETSASYRRIR
jgi:hypothetical protein